MVRDSCERFLAILEDSERLPQEPAGKGGEEEEEVGLNVAL